MKTKQRRPRCFVQEQEIRREAISLNGQYQNERLSAH